MHDRSETTERPLPEQRGSTAIAFDAGCHRSAMSRDELTRAADLLHEASAEMEDEPLAERTSGVADQLERFTNADSGPDHGRIARMENTLREIAADADGDTERTVEDAHEHLSAYRSTVQGV